MAILVRDDGGAAPTLAPTQPPVVNVPVQPPVVAPVQPLAPAPASPSGGGEEEARGLPQQGGGRVGPIVEPHPQPAPPPVAPPPVAPPPPPSEPAARVDVTPDHRGLPQPGDQPGDVGPIVKPHGEPTPSEQGTTVTTGPGSGGASGEPSDGTRTLESAFAPDHRDDAAKTWLSFMQVFSTLIPHQAHGLKTAIATLPKVVR